jgi:hypothetical protein
LAFSATQADAEVAIDGGRDEMQVRVENDTVGHVLEALGQNVSLHYRSAASSAEVFRVPWRKFCPAFSPVTILSSITTSRGSSSSSSKKAARRLSRLRQ